MLYLWPILLHKKAYLFNPTYMAHYKRYFLDVPTLHGRSSTHSGFQISYTCFPSSASSPSKPLLIFHGYAENGTVNFEKLALEAAMKGHDTYILDWPGHGESDKISGIPFYAETQKDYSEACLQFFKTIQTVHLKGLDKRVDVLAHSMGGAILTATLGSPEGHHYQPLIHTLIFSAPMFALKGLGYISQCLYHFSLGKKILAFMARHRRTPQPFNFSLQDLTENIEEQKRILERQRAKTSDYLVNSESDWILAANEMMTHVAHQNAEDWKAFTGQPIIWASPRDKITDGPRSIQIFQKIFPEGIIKNTSRPHRIHTHPEVFEEILTAL